MRKQNYSLSLANAFCMFFLSLLFFSCHQNEIEPNEGGDKPKPEELVTDNGTSGITYQLLVYSFCDSNGDGVGDFNGITSKLDYLQQMGVNALWLSPIHPASSYHGYDVLDYSDVNPEYGTMADFQNLINKAHEKNIKIYIDYVLNHTSKNHPWFLDAISSESSEYRDYFIFSKNPQADIKAGKIPMISSEGGNGYDSGQWFSAVSSTGGSSMKVKFTLEWGSAPTLKIEKVNAISNTGSQNSGKYLYYGDGKMAQFYSSGGSTYTLSIELASSWGVLVRTSTTSWDGGTKWGAPAGKNQLVWGTPLKLSNSDAQDILLPGMETVYYHSHFWTSYFADLNYGPAATSETSGAFKAVTEAADKWINMGVDGFRLDAVKHIYHNAASDENPTFLKKFYDRCNKTYKSYGHSDDIYMVAEHFSEASEVAHYYTALPAYFEFSFWWRLSDAINKGAGSTFAPTIQGYRDLYAKYRTDFIEATKLSNHDENRAANDLGKNINKEKLAAAVLLTAGGEPYIYQGEELGYWGVKNNGDEYVRTPMMWTTSVSAIADKKLAGKVDKSMLTSSISVATQSADENSILNVYRTFGKLRATYKALSKGSFTTRLINGSTSISAWYREYDGQKILVIHNFSGGGTTITLAGDKTENLIGSNGSVAVRDGKLTLGGYSSAVFLQ
ncbi:MAG: alpha-amylase [Bacteroidaceae bacterium]|nr:alpha-amylase [Bacteroidaceae bacterium]